MDCVDIDPTLYLAYSIFICYITPFGLAIKSPAHSKKEIVWIIFPSPQIYDCEISLVTKYRRSTYSINQKSVTRLTEPCLARVPNHIEMHCIEAWSQRRPQVTKKPSSDPFSHQSHSPAFPCHSEFPQSAGSRHPHR